MPAGTSWATFNQARLKGITRTTQALDALFAARPAALVAALQTGPFTGLPAAFRTDLSGRGLSNLELDHIRDWPDGQKDRVRAAVKNAISTNLTVRFVWKLYNGAREKTIIRPSGPNAITITFFSPWSKVRPTGPNDVTVDV